MGSVVIVVIVVIVVGSYSNSVGNMDHGGY